MNGRFAHKKRSIGSNSCLAFTTSGWSLLALIVGLCLIGFIDDYLGVRARRNLGLRKRGKTFGIVVIAAAFAWLAVDFATTPRACCYGRIGTCTVEFGTLASWLIDVLGIISGHFDAEGGMMFARPPLGELEPGPEAGPLVMSTMDLDLR